MNTFAFFAAVGLGCAGLSGCSGRNVDLDHAGTAGSSGATGRVDAIILDQTSDGISSELTVDDARLYWSTWGGRVQSCDKANCASTVLTYAGGAARSGALASSLRVSASAGNVFWIGSSPSGTILSCPVAGCTPSATKIFRDSGMMTGLFSDADYAYWASDIDLYRCKSSGCGATPELIATGEVVSPLVLGNDAYWTSHGTGSGGIRRAPKDGSGPPSVLVPAEAGMVTFTVNADTLFWENSDYKILSCPLADCSVDPTLVVDDSDSHKTDLLADDKRVYWRNEANLVQACSFADCKTPITVSTDPVEAFTVDVDFVYWTEVRPNPLRLGLYVHRLSKSAL